MGRPPPRRPRRCTPRRPSAPWRRPTTPTPPSVANPPPADSPAATTTTRTSSPAVRARPPARVGRRLGSSRRTSAAPCPSASSLWAGSLGCQPLLEAADRRESITFENFIIQAGTDASLVPTDMATTNATIKFTYKNTGTFFGIHVTADPFTLSYSQLDLAAGDLKKFYQGRSGRRTASVNVKGNKVPLFGLAL